MCSTEPAMLSCRFGFSVLADALQGKRPGVLPPRNIGLCCCGRVIVPEEWRDGEPGSER